MTRPPLLTRETWMYLIGGGLYLIAIVLFFEVIRRG